MRSLSLKSAVALLAAGWLLSYPAPTWARGMGHEFFLLAPDGKLVRQLGSRDFHKEALDWVDGKTEMVYRWDGKKLLGLDFAGKQLWTYAPPTALNWHTNFDSASGVLYVARYGADWQVGLEPKTGKELYKTNFSVSDMVPLTGGLPGLYESADTAAFRYFLSREDEPHFVKKVDQRTGKIVWRKQLPAKTQMYGDLFSVTHGVIRWVKGLYFFDPATGAEVKEIPTDPKATRQVFFHSDGVFHLSGGPSPTLTVYEPGTWKPQWSVEELTGVTQMVGPYAHHRLLCRSDKAVFVIDTKQQKLLAKLAPLDFKDDYGFCYQTKDAVLVLTQAGKNTLTCYSVPAGKVQWSRPTGPVGEDIVAVRQDQVLFVEKGPAPKMGKAGKPQAPPVTAVSLDSGEELWRWQVPQLDQHFADSLHVRVEACASGFIVTRTWLVLD